MISRKFLFEMFMPEARFPDEKFWDKDGEPIQAKPKGPPAGTTGKTHADIGADADSRAKKMGIGKGSTPEQPPQDWSWKYFPPDDGVYPNAHSVEEDEPDAFNSLEDVILTDPYQMEFLYDQDGKLHAHDPKDEGGPWYVWDRGGWSEAHNFNPRNSTTG